MKQNEFTKEVNSAIAALKQKAERFENSLKEIDGFFESNAIRPGQLLLALQYASDCAQAFADLDRAYDAEEKKNSEKLISLQNSHKQKIAAIKASAVSKASSIISEVSGFQDLADQVKESIATVSKRSPESIFSGTNYPAPGPSNFSSARSEAQRAKSEFKKDALESHSKFAWWGAGGATVISWISGVSFVAGLGIGGLVALGAFVVYGSKYNTSAAVVRRLVKSAEIEFVSIRKKRSDDEAKAQKEYADDCRIEEDRFKAVKKAFQDHVEYIDYELLALADQLENLSLKWQERHKFLFRQPSEKQRDQVSDYGSETSKTRFAPLGTASASALFINPSS